MSYWGRRVACSLGAPILLYGMYEAWQVQVREYEVALAHLPPQAEGLRVLQLSDIHYGLLMPRPLLKRVLRLAAAQSADVVVLTGDMVSRRDSYWFMRFFARRITEYAQVLAEELRVLQPPHGIWAVPGNHDPWHGSFAPIADELAQGGVAPLVNQAVRLSNGLALVGMDDLRVAHPDLKAAFEAVRADEGHLILSHNPRLALQFRQREALVLSGHTHAGQIKLPLLPPNAPADAWGTFWQGGFYRVGHAQLYVSAGVGTVGLPARIGVPPEMAVFTLRGK